MSKYRLGKSTFTASPQPPSPPSPLLLLHYYYYYCRRRPLHHHYYCCCRLNYSVINGQKLPAVPRASETHFEGTANYAIKTH